jgi:hypothetical protein
VRRLIALSLSLALFSGCDVSSLERHDAGVIAAIGGDAAADSDTALYDAAPANADAALQEDATTQDDAAAQDDATVQEDATVQDDAAAASDAAATPDAGVFPDGGDAMVPIIDAGTSTTPADAGIGYTISGPTPAVYVPLANPTVLTITGDSPPEDDGEAVMTMPFAFDFFGVPVTDLTINVNAILGFSGIDENDSWQNRSFPSTRAPNNTIAIWWDDLFIPGAATANIAYEIAGSAPNQTLAIQWTMIRHISDNFPDVRYYDFQIVLHEQSGVIQFNYGPTTENGEDPENASASAGIEDATGNFGYELLPCSPLCEATDYPADSTVTFTP